MAHSVQRSCHALLAVLLVGCSRSDAADAPRGEALFASTCARCHGADGAGGLPLATGQTPRNFRDHAFHASRSDADLKRTIREGRPPGMPPFGATFDEAQVTALVAHLRSLDPEGKGKR